MRNPDAALFDAKLIVPERKAIMLSLALEIGTANRVPLNLAPLILSEVFKEVFISCAEIEDRLCARAFGDFSGPRKQLAADGVPLRLQL